MSRSADPIPDLCPARSLSLITGGSHSGKHEFLIALVSDLLAGKPVLSGRTPPPDLNIGWLTFTHGSPEQSKRDLLQQFESHGCRDIWNSEHFAARCLHVSALTDLSEPGDPRHTAAKLTPEKVRETFRGAFGTSGGVRSTNAVPNLLILDDIHTLLLDASSNSPYHVTRLMQTLRLVLHDCDMTVLALALMTKLKNAERFKKIPDRIHGSVAWGAAAHSVWLVDTEDEDEKTAREGRPPLHRLSVALRGGRTETWPLEPDSRGLLVVSSLDELAAQSSSVSLTAWLDSLEPGSTLRTSQIVEHAATLALSRASAERWLRDATDHGRLPKVGHGLYKVTPVC